MSVEVVKDALLELESVCHDKDQRLKGGEYKDQIRVIPDDLSSLARKRLVRVPVPAAEIAN